MSQPTRRNFDLPLLDQLAEGLILLDRKAQVLSHNQVAEPWVKQAHAMQGVLKDLLDLEARGRIKLPVKLGLWSGKTATDEHPGEAWLIMDGRHDNALCIVPVQSSHGAAAKLAHPPAAEQNFLSLLGDEARSQITALRLLLAPQAGHALHNAAAITLQSKRVESLLQQLSDLSLLMQRDEVFADERLSLTELVRAALPPVTLPVDPELAVFSMGQDSPAQGVVYGHAAWMRYALRVLFEALQDSAPARSQINIRTRQMGNFVIISGHVAAIAHRRSSKATAQSAATDGNARPAESRDSRVRWLMCRRIIALHGGQLKLAFLPAGGADDASTAPMESFTLTLGTGQPINERSRVSCGTCRHVLQGQAYAFDLSQLLNNTSESRRDPACAAS
jgi:hypothetical protein